jgi:hypothetical protein
MQPAKFLQSNPHRLIVAPWKTLASPALFVVFGVTAMVWWIYGRETLPDKASIPLKDRKPIYYKPGGDQVKNAMKEKK